MAVMENEQNSPSLEASKPADFKIETIHADMPTMPTAPGTTLKPVNAQTTTGADIKKASFNPETTTKYVEVVDKLMTKKAGKDVWDVSSEEEKMLGAVWTDYLNEKCQGIDPKTSKLALASFSTITIYLPRIAGYLAKIAESRRKKTSAEKEYQTELKPTTEEKIPADPNVAPQDAISPDEVPWEKKVLIQ
jgi:hypothetical protein